MSNSFVGLLDSDGTYCGFVNPADVLVTGLRCEAITARWRLEGVEQERESRVYPGSAPPMEVTAYVLLFVYWIDGSRLQGCEIANLDIERL